jgi:apolipoprotein N-acyltransferase
VLILSSLQFIPYVTAKVIKRYKSEVFIISWLLLEFTLLNSTINFPIPVLGTALTHYPLLIQWWEITGVLGGSFWILVGNIIFLKLLENKITADMFLKLGLLIMFPIGLSLFLYLRNSNLQSINANFAILSTNLPCKDVKYNLKDNQVTQFLIDNSKKSQLQNSNTILVWPETALVTEININNLNTNQLLDTIYQELLEDNFDALITGLFLKEDYTETSNIHDFYLNKGRFKGDDRFYFYNGLITLYDETYQYRNKEKLVPFNEFLPFPNIMSHLENLVYTGPKKFAPKEDVKNIIINKMSITPLICYESFTGNFVRQFTKQKSDVICVILNEGWYNNMRGFQISQGLSVARAIENRKYVVKSSNCGISCCINEKGKIVNDLPENINGLLEVKPKLNSQNTIYILIGDIGTILIFFILIAFNVICYKKYKF